MGLDSHTPMVNGVGVLAWGVGGIEAEAAILGQPIYFIMPEVIGLKLTGKLPLGSTATDLVLTIANVLRKYGVVGKFVEVFGPGLDNLSVPDRAAIGNIFEIDSFIIKSPQCFLLLFEYLEVLFYK